LLFGVLQVPVASNPVKPTMFGVLQVPVASSNCCAWYGRVLEIVAIAQTTKLSWSKPPFIDCYKFRSKKYVGNANQRQEAKTQ
jgi:hypothetical protein